jgi:hypothetical protein
MANTVPPLVLRIPNGTPLFASQGDNNLTTIVNFLNALAAITGISLNPDGTIKVGALNNINQIANLSTFADAFNANGSLPAGVYSAGAGPPAPGTYAVTQPAITALAAGQLLRFKADTANAGAATVTINTFVPQNIFKNDTIALAAGDILIGDVVTLLFDGTNFQLLALQRTATAAASGSVLLAASSDVLAGTDAAKAVTSATLGANPGVAKAEVKFTVAAGVVTMAYAFNVSSVTRTAAGDFTINFATPFSTGDYCVAGSAKVPGGSSAAIMSVHTSDTGLATAKRISVVNLSAVGLDTEVHFIAWGAQ